MLSQEGLSALRALPDDWAQDGRMKLEFVAAALLAARTVANVRPDAGMLCASHLADELKGKDLVDWVISSRQQLQ